MNSDILAETHIKPAGGGAVHCYCKYSLEASRSRYDLVNILDVWRPSPADLPRPALKFIAKIFNSSLALNYFPTLWKVAKIIMLPKSGKDHSSPLPVAVCD
jgi:hypothetical protein